MLIKKSATYEIVDDLLNDGVSNWVLGLHYVSLPFDCILHGWILEFSHPSIKWY